MLKKISAVVITTILSAVLTVNTFAYTNMYQSNSNIPDFAEFTGAKLVDKQYAYGSTIYIYTTPFFTEELDYSKVNWFYVYTSTLNNNGYKMIDSDFFTTDSQTISVHFYNQSKGLYLDLYYQELGIAIAIHK